MKSTIAIVLWLSCIACQAAAPPGRPLAAAAYPEPEAAAAWQALAASYQRKARSERKLSEDPVLNGRAATVMAAVGAAVAAIDPRFASAAWKVVLIEEFGHGAVAFPGETILVDAKFVRTLALTDDELALLLAHEAAHVVAGHAYEKLSFMAAILGKDAAPTARAALLEFLARDAYAEAFGPVQRLQEREADRIGAAILLGSGYDAQRALGLFDRLLALEAREAQERHDSAASRKRAMAVVLAKLRQPAAVLVR
jgi:predicted Zn-dependent protease